MAKKKTKKLSEFERVTMAAWGAGQTIGFRAVVKLLGQFPTTLRIVIFADRAHAFQGHGEISIWMGGMGDGWAPVHTIAGELLEASRSAYADSANVGQFEDDVRELLRVALEVIGDKVYPTTRWMFDDAPEATS